MKIALKIPKYNLMSLKWKMEDVDIEVENEEQATIFQIKVSNILQDLLYKGALFEETDKFSFNNRGLALELINDLSNKLKTKDIVIKQLKKYPLKICNKIRVFSDHYTCPNIAYKPELPKEKLYLVSEFTLQQIEQGKI